MVSTATSILSSVFERKEPIRLFMPFRNFMYLAAEKGMA